MANGIASWKGHATLCNQMEQIQDTMVFTCMKKGAAAIAAWGICRTSISGRWQQTQIVK